MTNTAVPNTEVPETDGANRDTGAAATAPSGRTSSPERPKGPRGEPRH